MKYYYGIINEMINGFETSNKFFISAKTLKSAENKLNKAMKVWRDGCDYQEDSVYYFDGGGIAVSGYILKEIPKEHFDILIEY